MAVKAKPLENPGEEGPVLEKFDKCPACGKKTRHAILRKKGAVAIAKCVACGSIHYVKSEAKTREIMLLLSEGGRAVKRFKRFGQNESFEKSGLLCLGKNKFEIRAIETLAGERPDKAKVANVRAIWLAPYKKKISVSVHKDGTTLSEKLTLYKDESVRVGEVVSTDGKMKVEIICILTACGRPQEAQVKDILALQGKPA